MNVNVDAKKLLQSLDWAIFARGEIRKGRWGLLGDGFYAELSGSGNLGGVLYKSGSLTVQQGLASLALAYRIIDDRRGFLDFYAGARYNYLGVSISATIDESGIEEIGDNLTQRIANQIGAGVPKRRRSGRAKSRNQDSRGGSHCERGCPHPGRGCSGQNHRDCGVGHRKEVAPGFGQ